MNIKLLLKGNHTYSWTNSGNIYFLGYFFDSENNLYRENEAVEFIVNQLKINPLEEVCKRMNGNFSFIIFSENQYSLVSDSVNFFPLFYKIENEELIISNYWKSIVEYSSEFQLNTEAIDEFENAGFVLSDETLDKNIYKTNANQILNIDPDSGKKNIIQYRNFITGTFSEKSFEELSVETENVLMNVGKRLISFLNNRTAIVPLSGGYDSRLIVSLLKKMNYKNVICITYGKYNPEVPISKKVAENLDYEWHFIDYQKIDIEHFRKESRFSEYLEDAANGFAMPYLMEYFAAAELQKNGQIPENSVFLPGHSGDFLGGSYIFKTVKNTIDFQNLNSFIESKYFIFLQKNNRAKNQISERVKQSLKPIGKSYIQDGFNMTVEEWDIQEKLAKFIFHSSQVFNFFGFEVYFPLWDRELVDFFRKVPFRFRENKKLYDFVAENAFFVPQNISFQKNELKVSKMRMFTQKIKDSVRYFFPWKMVLKRINNADWPNYQRLTEEMLTFIENKKHKKFTHFKNYNAVICVWYVEFLKEKYKSLRKV